MADELKISADQFAELVAQQMARQAQKEVPQPKTSRPASKPYKEKSFVSVHYTALGTGDNDSNYSSRDSQLYVVLHFYLREGDNWQALQRDARNYAQTFQHAKIIAHDHAWNEPCSPAPKLHKCKEM